MSYVRAPYVEFRRKPWGTAGWGDVTSRIWCGTRNKNINVRERVQNGVARASQTRGNARGLAG